MKKASRDLRKHFRPLKVWFQKELPDGSYAYDCTFAKFLSDMIEWSRHYLPANHPSSYPRRQWEAQQKAREANKKL